MPTNSYRDEINRKAIHLASAALPIFYWLTDLRAMLVVLFILLGLSAIMEVLRLSAARTLMEQRFGSLFRREERFSLTGASYVILANLMAVAVFTKPIAIAVLLFLSISDALASLVGKRWGGGMRFLGKSAAGSAAFFISAAAIALLVLPDQPLAGLAGAAAATIIEALGPRIGRLRLDDNFSIPIVGGVVISLLSGAWVTFWSA